MSADELWAKIQGLHAKWAPILGLGDWQDMSYLDHGEHDGVFAEVVMNQWEYKRFRIRYTSEMLKKEDLEAVVVHELVHVLTAPIRNIVEGLLSRSDEDDDSLLSYFFRLHDERATTEIASALRRAESGRVDPAPAGA